MDRSFYPGRLSGIASAPASKSEAHRRLMCAGLSDKETVLDGFMVSDDMKATCNCLRAMGASFSMNGSSLTVHGCGSSSHTVPVMDCGESGSTLRFFVPVALVRCGGGVFRMHGRLSQRPMDIYRDLFVPQGCTWRMGIGADGAAELHVTGKLPAGQYVLPGNVSSQFVSGLLFALPMLPQSSTLTVKPPVESSAYITMTLKALAQSGIVIREKAPWSWEIPGGQHYTGLSGRLKGDWSQAAVYLCAAALGCDLTVAGLDMDTTQGDKAVLDCLEKLGAVIDVQPDGIRVSGKLHGAELDVRDCPDIAPILALVCQLAEGSSRITGCGRLRLKECDRLEATVNMLNALGGHVRTQGDDMIIEGVSELQGGAAVDACRDHRMVMLASIAALRCREPITVPGVEALDKSWPDYLKEYEQLGGKAE